MRRLVLLLFVLGSGALVLPAAVAAQTQVSARASTIRFGGRVHAQYATSSAAEVSSVFFRRVRLIADITLNDFVSARVQPDFKGGATALQDVYVRLAFSDGFRVSVGQFKRAFDLFELSSSTDLSLIERDGRVDGVSSCSGVGGVCSYSRLTEKLAYAGRDQGVKVDGSSGRLSYLATLTNGTGINTADENDAKSFSGRLTVAATDDVRISGQVGVHDYLDADDESAYATSFAADVEVGSWRDGLHFQAAVATGDNWKVRDEADEPASFVALQGVVSWYRGLQGDRLAGVEPLVRVSFGDPDSDLADDGGVVFTPGLMFYFTGKNKIGANLDVYSPQTGDTEYSLKLQTFLYF